MENLFDKGQTNHDDNVCRKLSADLNGGIHIRAEVHDHENVLAARNETFKLTGKDVSTDFPVKQADGKVNWYEEYPTKTDPVTGKTLLQQNDLYPYNPETKQREQQAISRDSNEYKQANEALAVLRAKYTPKAILELPSCVVK